MQHGNGGSLAAEPCCGLWLQVCRARGTLLPEPSEVARFLAQLPEQAKGKLEHALRLCLHGREKQRELACVSWAAA